MLNFLIKRFRRKIVNPRLELILRKHLAVIFSTIALLLTTACGSNNTDSSTEISAIEDNNSGTETQAEQTILYSDLRSVETAALESLGEKLYKDTNLSNPIGQSCESCHNQNIGFDDPNEFNPTSLGADGISFGTRNSPTASYASFIPEPTNNGGINGNQLVGGLFLDGRAINLEEQAKGPFLNLNEMGNQTMADVIEKVRNSNYVTDFESLFGNNVLSNDELSFAYIADAIAAFERTTLFSPFSSHFDNFQAGRAVLTATQQRGRNLFNGKADCQRCHGSERENDIFSDFEYRNIGVPPNPLLPALIENPLFVDFGLGGETDDFRQNGRFRTPALRNIAITAPYMHNGVFSTLEEVVDFYNTRDTSFPNSPEVTENLDQGGQIGELNLSANEISDLIAFLETLTDL